ncbi:MFS transporter [Phormidesmis sp. 146-12]
MMRSSDFLLMSSSDPSPNRGPGDRGVGNPKTSRSPNLAQRVTRPDSDASVFPDNGLSEESVPAMLRTQDTPSDEWDEINSQEAIAPNSSRQNGTSKHLSDDTNGDLVPQSDPLKLLNEAAALEEKEAVPLDAESESESESGFAPVLRNRNFLTLWAGQVFSQLADKVYLVLMIALIASRFQSEGETISGWVSSIMIAFTIPAVLFGSVAGVFVDRWSKKGVLVATNLLRGGLVFALPPLLWISKDWARVHGLPVGFLIMLGITFLVSTLTQFFAPAEQSAIPLIVERRHLLSANSLYTTTMMASVIIGFAVGEPLLALADAIVAHLGGVFTGIGRELLVGGGYAIAGLLLLFLRTGEKLKASTNGITPDEPEDYPHVWEDIKDGLRYLGKESHVRSALIQLVILFSIFAALAVLSVRLAEVIPEIKSSQFGFLLAAGGVGMVCGAAIIGYFGQRLPHARLGLYGSLGMSASLVGLAFFYHTLWVTLLLIALLGGFASLVGIPMQTTIQQETPEEMRGKVFGLQNNAINIALSLPLVLAGVSETLFGLRAVFLALAALTIAGATLTWYISRTTISKTS